MEKVQLNPTKKSDDNFSLTTVPTCKDDNVPDNDATEVMLEVTTEDTEVMSEVMKNMTDVFISATEMKKSTDGDIEMNETGSSLDDNAGSKAMNYVRGRSHISVGMRQRCHSWDTAHGYKMLRNKKLRNLAKVIKVKKLACKK